MQASCPGCNTLYVLDDRQGMGKKASMTCLECGQVWDLATTRSPDTSRTQTSPPPRRSPGPAAPKPAPRRKRPPTTEQLSCPECGHRFSPAASRRGRTGKGSRTILLVEDQKYFAELTRDALGGEYRTVVADTIARARDLLESSDFDLVILDLSLEGQDGSTILRTTTQRGIPVLVFTARDETELYSGEWDKLRSAGATDILIKGMNVEEELREKVAGLLRDSG